MNLVVPRCWRLFIFFATLCPMLAAERPPELQYADKLRLEASYPEAREVYERWLRLHPEDAEAHFDYGYCLFLQARTEGQAPSSTELRKRAFAEVTEAKLLGSNHPLIELMFAETNEKGDDLAKLSEKPEVDAALKRGEQAFTANKWDEALKHYQSALTIDPRSYQALLFIGDVYFSQEKYREAITWFEKATRLHPDYEVAYRYWGDALAHQGKVAEARDRYIEAVVAEPYNRLSLTMLEKFAEAQNVRFHRLSADIPSNLVGIYRNKPVVNSALAQRDPALLGYASARVLWFAEQRGRYFSADAPLRHSLPEECYGLRQLVKLVGETESKDAASVAKLKPSVELLKSLDRDGLLEAFVLLDFADRGIVEDYAAYQLANRAKLHRYISERWLSLPLAKSR